jgi:hypothetical protein
MTSFNQEQVINNTLKFTLNVTEEQLNNLLVKDPYLYLEKHGKFLTEGDFKFFSENFPNNSEVTWYLKKNSKTFSDKTKIKNRRYKAINELEDYFSLEEMKQRRPELYSQIIGKHYKKEGESFDKSMKVYERILQNYDYSTYTERIMTERETEEPEENIPQETEEEDEDKDFEYFIEKNKKESKPEILEISPQEVYHLEIDNENIEMKVESNLQKLENEKDYLIQFFTSEMKRMFIEGEDEEFFDYSKVDKDESFDDIDQMLMDSEEKYFDGE